VAACAHIHIDTHMCVHMKRYARCALRPDDRRLLEQCVTEDWGGGGPALAGLSITYAMQMTVYLNGLIRALTLLETQMNAGTHTHTHRARHTHRRTQRKLKRTHTYTCFHRDASVCPHVRYCMCVYGPVCLCACFSVSLCTDVGRGAETSVERILAYTDTPGEDAVSYKPRAPPPGWPARPSISLVCRKHRGTHAIDICITHHACVSPMCACRCVRDHVCVCVCVHVFLSFYSVCACACACVCVARGHIECGECAVCARASSDAA
jgi:hypothetical protein